VALVGVGLLLSALWPKASPPPPVDYTNQLSPWAYDPNVVAEHLVGGNHQPAPDGQVLLLMGGYQSLQPHEAQAVMEIVTSQMVEVTAQVPPDNNSVSGVSPQPPGLFEGWPDLPAVREFMAEVNSH
jgi:hypothetical protein